MAEDKKQLRRAAFKQGVRHWFRQFLESFLAVVPIVVLIVVIYFTGVIPREEFSPQLLVSFVICAFAIVIGLTSFNLGSNQSMTRIGEIVGETLFKRKNLFIIIAMTFILGVAVTVAEPDLKTMAGQIGCSELLLILVIGIGVGIFVVIGVIRILRNKRLNVLFLAFYAIVFALAAVVNPKFLPIAFDSGGVTTGPVTVPFILAFGAGLAASRASGGRTGDDSFGITALASVGPIIAVMVLGLFMDVDAMVWTPNLPDSASYSSWSSFWPFFAQHIGEALLGQLKNVAFAVVPLFVLFLIYNWIFVRMPMKRILQIFVGLIYVYVGLVIFMSAVECGFLPVAQQVGFAFGDPSRPSLFPLAVGIGALFGLFGVLAEPAVHVLVRQIEKVSEGTIRSRTVLIVMALAIAGGVSLSIVRAHYQFPILYYTIPGYAVALGLSFVVPKIYFAIAFDSGGVASGPMASTFVMPFCIGFAYANHGSDSVYSDAFGCVAMIALMPLIVIQFLGVYAELKRQLVYQRARKRFIEPNDNQIIHFAEDDA